MTEYNIRLNPNCAAAVHTGLKFKAGDKGIEFKIAVDELDTTGTAAKIVFQRANGTSVESDITGTDGVYTYKTLGNEFAVPGKTVADVKFYAADARVSTASFVFEVSGDTMDGLGAGAGGYSDRLEQLATEAEDAMKNAENVSKELENLLTAYQNKFGEVGVLNPKGTYNSATIYEAFDLVYYGGVSWLCLQRCTGVTPAEGAYWQLFASADGGNAEKLGGKSASEWQSAVDNIQTTSRATLSTAGWYRVAEYDALSTPSPYYILRGASSQSCELTIKRSYNNNVNEWHKLRLNAMFPTLSFDTLGDKSQVQLFTKVRYVLNDSIAKAYIEAYYTGNVAEMVSFIIDSASDYYTHWQAITPTLTEETVDGVTVATTYDIPANATLATTADLANYLPLSGGKVSASGISPLKIDRNDNATNVYIEYSCMDTILGQLGFHEKDIPYFRDTNGGLHKLLHTGNKPTGSYTGNGSATERTIYIGGTGNFLLVREYNYFALVSRGGAVVFDTETGTTRYLKRAEANFTDGYYMMETTESGLNYSGNPYHYQVL